MVTPGGGVFGGLLRGGKGVIEGKRVVPCNQKKVHGGKKGKKEADKQSAGRGLL